MNFLKDEVEECRDRLANEGSSMLLTAVTLVFALIGCSNRMRFKADFPIQKALGMVTDFLGFMTLLVTLVEVGVLCNKNVARADETGVLKLKVTTGIGYIFYVICLLGAFFRALFHWCTPTPQKWNSEYKDKKYCEMSCCNINIEKLDIPPEVREMLGVNGKCYALSSRPPPPSLSLS